MRVETTPEVSQPGSEAVMTAVITAEDMPGNAWEIAGTEVIFFDAAETEIARVALMDGPSGSLRSAPVECIVPDLPGSHHWTARIQLPPARSTDAEESTVKPTHRVDFTITVAPHPISMTVWDIPPAIMVGQPFSMTLGLKCPCGCDARGWGFRVDDADGKPVTSGNVGSDPWPGTEALFHAKLDLTAPDIAGNTVWTVTALPPDGGLPHAIRTLSFRLNLQPEPEVTLRIRAIDAETRAPVARAKVVAHPYRTLTDAAGLAELRVPRGKYTVFVSGNSYFAFKSVGEITEDFTLEAEMYADRESSVEEAWA